MNARLAKEIRPLLLPWCIAAFTAAGYLPALAHSSFAEGEFGSFLLGLPTFALVGGVLLLSALPMGFELQNCTLTTLLSQPVDRTRLWREKLNAATFSVIALGIVHGLASAAAGQLSLSVALLFGAFIVTAICSVGCHTLASRSIIVGIASAVAIPWAIALGAYLFAYYVLRLQTEPSEEATLALVLGAAAVYSAISLWLGRRQFMRLELKDAPAARGAQIPEVLVPTRLTALFRAQPSKPVWNLISKEVCLQKPIFLVSAIFTACWLSMLLLMVLRPAWQDDLVGVLHALTGVQVVLMVILIGCVALGDDKALGTTAWHLTLPIAIRRQWAIKLLVSAGTLVGMAVVLPMTLAALTLFKAPVGLLALRPDDLMGMAIPYALVFVMSFWSASMVTNTVRAALTTVLACVALTATASLAVWSATRLGGFQTGLLTGLIARLQWSPYSLNGLIPWSGILGCLIALVTLIALVQSFRQFRQSQSQSTTLVRHGVILVAAAFAIAFWATDLNVSMGNQRSQRFPTALVPEVTAALRSFTLQDSELAEGQVRTLTPQELGIRNHLSDKAKLWLRSSTINVQWSYSRSKVFEHLRVYGGSIYFPNGAIVPFSWTVPDLPQAQPPKVEP